MKLSVIIVNYNVRHFLEQCLRSVMSASNGLAVEVLVVDNNSVDGSVEMVREQFPEVKLIANTDNPGFSKANNQGIKISHGEYVLLLNPDTVVEDDTFQKVIDFMDDHPDAGGLGIRMVDGKGRFLPESKRGLPTPSVAFHKIFGLSWLFPKSKRFGKYHLGYLSEDETHEVDVLSGAFMCMRKKALDEVGLLDEQFFMYGEDIDLSYRLTQGGYKNYYYPEARIIHYKGESTKKGSLNYVYVFYNAMAIFARKHFSTQQARTFGLLINFAILLRASVALVRRLLEKMIVPLLDASALFGGMAALAYSWEHYMKWEEGVHYPSEFYTLVIPSCILVWMVSVFFAGGYDKPIRIGSVLRGSVFGSLIVLVSYALMPETMRYSRAVILLSAVWSPMAFLLIRAILHLFKVKGYRMSKYAGSRFLIVGSGPELKRVTELIKLTYSEVDFMGYVSVEGAENSDFKFLGNTSQLNEMIRVHTANEVIFCAADLPSARIIDLMSQCQTDDADFKIAPSQAMFIIGSNSINNAGDLYTVGLNTISKPSNRRLKRLSDVFISLLLLILWPLLAWFTKSPIGYLKNIFWVLIGDRTWVGYAGSGVTFNGLDLPPLPRGVISMADVHDTGSSDIDVDMLYARNYRLSNDLVAMVKGIRLVGRG